MFNSRNWVAICLLQQRQHKEVDIGVVYRPSSRNFPLFIDKLTHIVDIINLNNYGWFHIEIKGDFNFDLFKKKDDARLTEYYITMVGERLFPLILRPTRVSHASIKLDHVWSNFADKNVASGVAQCDLSDHYALFTNFLSNSVSKIGKKRFSEVAILLMPVLELSLVLTFNWNSVRDINNANSCYDEFMHKFASIDDSSFPVKTIKVLIKESRKSKTVTIEREKKNKQKILPQTYNVWESI